MATAGYFIASKLRDKKEKLWWTGKVQTIAIICLVLLMAMRMGSNQEVIDNIGTIGLSALVITVLTQVFSVIGVIVARKLMRIDRYGYMASEEGPDTAKAKEGEKPKLNRLTLIICACVVIGMAMGYLIILPGFAENMDVFSNFASRGIQIGLCILIFFVGSDLGLEGTVFKSFKKVGARVLVFPVVIGIMTLIASVISGLLINISLKESLAIGAGFAWYSLAPGIILEAGYVEASAMSFMYNVLREVLSILLIPTVANKIGHLETLGLAASPSMDVCLPIIERATSSHVAVYSFINGVVLSFAVPILVTLFIG